MLINLLILMENINNNDQSKVVQSLSLTKKAADLLDKLSKYNSSSKSNTVRQLILNECRRLGLSD